MSVLFSRKHHPILIVHDSFNSLIISYSTLKKKKKNDDDEEVTFMTWGWGSHADPLWIGPHWICCGAAFHQ